MNIIESSVAPPVLKNFQSRAESYVADESFNSLLFPAINTYISDESSLHNTNNTDVKFTSERSKTELLFASEISGDKMNVVIKQHLHADSAALKELYEQKLMANYSLSYIDVNNVLKSDEENNAVVCLQALTVKSHNETLVASRVQNPFKIYQESSAFRPAIMNKHSTLNEEVALSASIVSKRHQHNDSIEKSKVTIGRQNDVKSLYVRDHFSDQRTLAVVVADLLSKFKSKINEAIINGKRG